MYMYVCIAVQSGSYRHTPIVVREESDSEGDLPPVNVHSPNNVRFIQCKVLAKCRDINFVFHSYQEAGSASIGDPYEDLVQTESEMVGFAMALSREQNDASDSELFSCSNSTTPTLQVFNVLICITLTVTFMHDIVTGL